jgi:riboflavin biosynthesis pyrimidine reductase
VPTVHGELVAAAAVDELCLTVASLLAGGIAGRIAAGTEGDAPALAGTRALREDDGGLLLLRYRRAV